MFSVKLVWYGSTHQANPECSETLQILTTLGRERSGQFPAVVVLDLTRPSMWGVGFDQANYVGISWRRQGNQEEAVEKGQQLLGGLGSSVGCCCGLQSQLTQHAGVCGGR